MVQMFSLNIFTMISLVQLCRRDRGIQKSQGSGREKSHTKVVQNVMNGLLDLTGSC